MDVTAFTTLAGLIDLCALAACLCPSIVFEMLYLFRRKTDGYFLFYYDGLQASFILLNFCLNYLFDKINQ